MQSKISAKMETISSKYKCQVCSNIPEVRQVYQCENKHLMCIFCGIKKEHMCKVS